MSDARYVGVDINGATDWSIAVKQGDRMTLVPSSAIGLVLSMASTPQITVTDDYTMTQANGRVVMDSPTDKTIILPLAQASFNRRFVIMNVGAGELTVECQEDDIFIGNGASVTVMQGESLEALGIKKADNSYHYQRS